MNLTIRNLYFLFIFSLFTKINLSGFGVTEYTLASGDAHLRNGRPYNRLIFESGTLKKNNNTASTWNCADIQKSTWGENTLAENATDALTSNFVSYLCILCNTKTWIMGFSIYCEVMKWYFSFNYFIWLSRPPDSRC